MREDMRVVFVVWSHLAACWQVRLGGLVLGEHATKPAAELDAERWRS